MIDLFNTNRSLYRIVCFYNVETIQDENVEEFTVEILKVNSFTGGTKNILFEITDQGLLDITGGIVQGMSGSPIIQDDKIIGAVTHVIIDNPIKGYGVYIGSMLEEAEN